MTQTTDSETSLKEKSLKEVKEELRKEMQHKRKRAHTAYLQSDSAQSSLCDNFTAVLERLELERLGPASDDLPLCAGYFPMHSEIDPRPLMQIYEQRYGNVDCHSCLLPIVLGKQEPLLFRRYDGNESMLEDGAFSTKHPPETSGVAEPSLLLVPLLAFDEKCKRLGYGGGFYDRTIAALREREREKHNRVFTLVIAYEAQLVARVPSERHDLALDAILTEQRIYDGA